MKTFSKIRDKMGVSDIGRNSDGCDGDAIFGIGLIMARFHWSGTYPRFTAAEKSDDNDSAIKGAIAFRYQNGSMSEPHAVRLSVLRKW